MRRVVFVTQQIDPEHPVLAATVPMVRALAARVDEVVVIALRAVPGALPDNCRVYAIGAPTRLRRGLRYAWALVRSSFPRPVALIAHMCPIYAVLAAPVVRPLGVPIVLWFTHWRPSRLLRWAERASTRVVSVERGSFPLPSNKVVAIGHGIDLAQFPPQDWLREGKPLRALALGRTSPAKGLESIVRAVRLARDRGVDVLLEIRGPAETPEELAHREYLLGLADGAVHVAEPVPRSRLPEIFAETDVLVNNTAEGSLDKVVFEACASCVPVLASNPSFVNLLEEELRFDRHDVEAIAAGLEWLASLSPEERRDVGRALRHRIEVGHSTDTWADRVLQVAERR